MPRRHATPGTIGILLGLVLLGRTLAAPPPDESLTGADMAAIHAARRGRLASLVGEGTLLLFSEPERGPFIARPEPNLRYLTGLAVPGAAILIRVERNAEGAGIISGEHLYLPPANPQSERWTGPYLSPGRAAARATGVADTRSASRLFADLAAEAPAPGPLFLLAGHDPGTPWREELRLYRNQHPGLQVEDILPHLARLRAVKDTEEVARIRRACELTARGLAASMREARPGALEYELQAHLEYQCRAGGAFRQAFSSLVASGPNGTILHYNENRRRIEEGDLVLMDVGAEFMGYAADVTRTFPVGGRFTAEQAELFDAVVAAQAAALRTVRPGSTFAAAQAAANKVLAANDLASAFIHAIGHHVGLDVHDPAPAGRFEAGMVITIEPGIYLPERGIGIRIEDTVLVTETGAEVLSDAVPKSRAKIEALMRR